MSRHKVVLDTDPGIDDAMAIFTALAHPDIELLGLTTTFGNVSVEQASGNALNLLERAGAGAVSVATGVSKPLIKQPEPYPDFIHGKDGLGNINLSPPQGQVIGQSAADFIIGQVMAQPGEINLVAIGPLGNLAEALKREPAITQRVRQVVLMGGAIIEGGNVSPVAEANIYSDPHAADKVFAADWPVTMVGLDVTHRVLLSRALFQQIKDNNPRVGGLMQQAAEFYIDFYRQEREAGDGCFGHDVSAIAYVADPELFTTVEGAICVVPDGIAVGQTIMRRDQSRNYPVKAWDDRPTHKACMEVDSDGVSALFYKAMTGDYWQ